MNSKSPAGMSIHSISTDWNTPTKYIELIHKMFNVVEFDPCSNSDSIVKARREIILPNDGLKEEWNYRTIFVNPPFGRDFERKTTIKDWIAKCYEANQKYNSEVLLLIPVATNTSHWKEYIFNKASAICFLYDTRLRFLINGSEEHKGAPMACCLIYWGNEISKFTEHFAQYGAVVDISKLKQQKFGIDKLFAGLLFEEQQKPVVEMVP